ncbi:MAG: class I SAM-dependent methyltransferase [Sphingomonadaceae bacterium]|nr:class I SAM-dependent methyltransferase [Sphingomonadaceae bacterium]
MEPKSHWEHVYTTKSADRVSWFQEHADRSLRLIWEVARDRAASIIDVGGGASTLADDLLADGYSAVTVLDLSEAALEKAKRRIGAEAERATWLASDILSVDLPRHHFDVWHDRAVFHFLTKQQERDAYVEAALKAVKPGGFVIVATFAEDGPTECSGLPVRRYSAAELHAEFGAPFALLRHEKEAHATPFGTVQQFVYCMCRTTLS